MAGLSAQGTLWIEMVEVYTWLASLNVDTGKVASCRFDIEEDALVLDMGEDTPEYIDAVELWTWVINEQLPDGLRGLESVFGVPQFTGHDMTITFAVCSEGDPRNWANPPACLLEWKK